MLNRRSFFRGLATAALAAAARVYPVPAAPRPIVQQRTLYELMIEAHENLVLYGRAVFYQSRDTLRLLDAVEAGEIDPDDPAAVVAKFDNPNRTFYGVPMRQIMDDIPWKKLPAGSTHSYRSRSPMPPSSTG